MNFIIEFEQETDGRWIAEISEIPGVLVYGQTRMQAGEKAKAFALRVLADRREAERAFPVINRIGFTAHEPAEGSYKTLTKEGWPDYVFAFHDEEEEIGPRMLARITKHTGVSFSDPH